MVKKSQEKASGKERYIPNDENFILIYGKFQKQAQEIFQNYPQRSLAEMFQIKKSVHVNISRIYYKLLTYVAI